MKWMLNTLGRYLTFIAVAKTRALLFEEDMKTLEKKIRYWENESDWDGDGESEGDGDGDDYDYFTECIQINKTK